MLPERKIYFIGDMPEQISDSQRNALLELDTGTIGHHLEAGFMDPGIQQRTPSRVMVGTAVTVRITVPDSIMAHYALKFTRPNDILVIERGQDQFVTCWGGATTYAAAATGLSGVIIDGAANDITDATKAGLTVWSRSICPVTTKYRGLGGEMNIPVSCGGVAVNPGDAIIADENGIVAISPDILDETIEASQRWLKAETEFLERLKREPDLCYPDVTGASAIVEAQMSSKPKS